VKRYRGFTVKDAGGREKKRPTCSRRGRQILGALGASKEAAGEKNSKGVRTCLTRSGLCGIGKEGGKGNLRLVQKEKTRRIKPFLEVRPKKGGGKKWERVKEVMRA